MKVTLAALGLLLAWSVDAAPAPPSPDNPQVLASWFAELGPRREGSRAESQVFAALRTWFAPRAAVQESAFDEMEGEHSFSRRLWFRVAGTMPGELVVAVPTDGSNQSGLAWAAAWAQHALESPPRVSLTFLFTGAERGSGESAGLGSRAFLQDFYPTDPAAVLYLSSEPGSPLRLTTESGLFPSPLWMVRGMTQALEARGLTPQFTGTAPSLFRLDLPERKNALAPWFDRSVPALLMAGPPDEGIVRALEDFTESLVSGVPVNWDRHYLVFDLGFTKFFWSQAVYIGVFLAVAALLLFGYALAGRDRRGSLKVLGTGLWQIPVLFAFLFLSLYAGTLLASVLQTARGMPEFWRTSPLLVWSFKAFAAVCLYLFLFLPFRRSPLSRNPDFYGQAALLWLGFTVVAAAGLELTFSFYFLWALVWCAVLVAAPWRPLKLLALAAGPLWLVKAAWDVLGPRPDLALSQGAIASPVAGNFTLAVLFFPFLLQAAAWHFSGKRHQSRDEGLHATVQLTAWGVAALTLAVLVLRTPPGPLPPDLTPPRVVNAAETPGLWSAQLSRAAFLDRTVWTLRFTGSSDPEEVEFFLESDEPLTIFDCSFPVTLDAEGNRARIIVGRQPSLPLEIQLTLAASARSRLSLAALFAGSPGLKAVETIELSP